MAANPKIDNNQLIDEIWESMLAKKYLGIRKMKKILCAITEQYDIPMHLIEDMPLKDQFCYHKFQGMEKLIFHDLKLCRMGTSIRLERYGFQEQDGFEEWKEVDLYVFDWNLHLSYQSSNMDVCIEYSQYHKPHFNEKLKKMLEDRT